MVIAVAALAVAVALTRLESEHDGCGDATRRTFLASRSPEPVLRRGVEEMVRECSVSEPLTEIAVGLRARAPRSAARLARVAARREPDSYTAWAVLALTAPPDEAATAARRAAELNPLSASGARP